VQVLKATSQPEALLNRAASLINSGHTGAARALVAAARRLDPQLPRSAELAARIAMHEGHLDEARGELDAAITTSSANGTLRKLRSEVRRMLDDVPGAAADAAEAVVLDSSDPVAKALLGVLLLDLHRTSDAVTCLREAVATEPANPAFCEALAVALDVAGDPDGALATLVAGIAAAPRYVNLRNAVVLHCIRQRDFNTAARFAEEARVIGVVDACLFGLKGHALSSLGRHDEAADAYAEALKLGPEDPYVRHLAAAAGTVPGASRAPADYLRAVFNGCAARFDAHLLSLGYRVPGLIHNALKPHAAGQAVLDLGCGTGLLALVLADLKLGPFIGVDIADGMLERAAAKQLYSELHRADVLDFLRDDTRSWELVLAGDVLCYFGALDELFRAVRARLVCGGLFIFSVELLLPDRGGVIPGNGDWALGWLGRYSHAEQYIIKAVADAELAVNQATREILRNEADTPVLGLLVTLERQDAH
jgi:predicted TPR repeat methyltransferase